MKDIEKTEIGKGEKTKFEKLVKCAEKYIVDNAETVLLAIRNQTQKAKLQPVEEYSERCKDLIKEIYQPDFVIDEENNPMLGRKKRKELNDYDVIVRFCIELQNYQAMPRAINYWAYNYEESNDAENRKNYIAEVVQEFNKLKPEKVEKIPKSKFQIYHRDLYYELKKNRNIAFDEEKELPDAGKKITELGKYFKKEGNKYFYNYAWYKYSRGLYDALALKKINVEEIKQQALQLNKKITSIAGFDYKIKVIKEFNKGIYYMGDTLTFDFFKELACENLVKADVHIKELFKNLIYSQDNNAALEKLKQSGKRGITQTVDNQIAFDFIKLCDELSGKDWYTPYYIDKILWLCCTGAFYEDDIIINKMTRNNFIKYVKSS